MPSFKETLTINDKPLGDRAVEVTVIAPEGKNVLNVQQLAERAWRTVDKKITVDGVTVKVRSFRR